MGSKAKIIVPLIALAGIGIATGGFGLAGAGAVEGGTLAGGAAAEIGGATALAGSVTPLIAAGEGLTAASTSLVSTEALLAQGPVLNTAVGGITNTASQGLFADLATSFSNLSTFGKVGLGFKGIGAGSSVISGAQSAAAAETAASIQENEVKTRALVDELGLTSRLNETERKRGEAFARIANAGFDDGALTTAANSSATGEGDLLSSQGDSLLQSGASRLALLRGRRRPSVSGAVTGGLVDFGGSAFETLRG